MATIQAPDVDEEDMQMIYNWVDEIPLSRPKKNIGRDFADGGKIFSNSLNSRNNSSLFPNNCRTSQLFQCIRENLEVVQF